MGCCNCFGQQALSLRTGSCIGVLSFGLVLGMTVPNRGAFVLELAVGVVLKDVVGDELNGVIGARLAHFGQRTHHSGRDSLLQVRFRRQVVHAHWRLLGHCRELSLAPNFRVRVAALRIEIVFFLGGNLDELLFHLLAFGHLGHLVVIRVCHSPELINF